ncbi:MAG: hypothetical protein GY861_09530 [bacterium]|jgi:hypothetical protein|nr:hypothetical protein [bacterium]
MESEYWYIKRREARAAALQKEHEERIARLEGSLYNYMRQEFKKTWEAYAIIAGGAFLGIFLLLFWIMYLNWDFRSTYRRFLD